MILLFLDRVECEAQNIDLQVTLEILLPAPLSQVRDLVNETIARICLVSEACSFREGTDTWVLR
jgi:hypothetical protein